MNAKQRFRSIGKQKKERITGMTRSEQNTVIMFATQRNYTM